MTKAEIEGRLRKLGSRRLRHEIEAKALQGAVADAVADAKGVITMDRMAELLHLHRSTLYHTYLREDPGERQSNGGSGEAR